MIWEIWKDLRAVHCPWQVKDFEFFVIFLSYSQHQPARGLSSNNLILSGIIVAAILLLTALAVDLARMARRDWNLLLSGMGMGISLILLIERYPF